MITVATALWYDPAGAYNRLYTYGPGHVNAIRSMLSRHLTLPHEVVCITDQPNGLHPGIRTVPLDRSQIGGPRSRFPKLAVWRMDAAEVFGSRILWLDLDTVIVRSIDPIVDRPEPLVLWRNSSWGKPGRTRHNTSVFLLDAGSRPDIAAGIERGDHLPYAHDQAYVSHMVGEDCATWGFNDTDGIWKARDMRHGPLPHAARIVTFPGKEDPSMDGTRRKFPWIAEHWC